MNDVLPFIGGMVTMGFIVASIFFLRFWSRTREGLFASFAAAFLLLGVNQAMITLTNIPAEERSPLYLLRLTAFVLILIAIWRTNRRAGR